MTPATPIRIGITGANGRMGEAVTRAVLGGGGVALSGALTQEKHGTVGLDIALRLGLPPIQMNVSDDAEALFKASDVVVDFTRPEASLAYAELATHTGTAMVCGTTGFNDGEMKRLESAARKTRLLWGANMSLGVNLLIHLVRQTAGVLGEDYDIEIMEMHHRHKVDAPSGTAKALAEAAAEGREVALMEKLVTARDGITGARRPGDIGMAVLRGGDVVGDHQVVFAGTGERLELGHRASTREVFANGALSAARWLLSQPTGKLYRMQDVVASKL